MKYPKRLLAEDETIAFDVRHHPLMLWRPAAAAALYLALWLAGVILFDVFRHGWSLLAGAVVLVILLAWLGWWILVWSRVDLILTNHRLIYRSGVTRRRVMETPLSRVTDVTTSQKVLGRLFGFGDMVVVPPGAVGKAHYHGMPHPEQLKLQILKQVRGTGELPDGEGVRLLAEEVAKAVNTSRSTQPIAPVPPERPPLYSEIVDQIDRLDKLRERGAISADEFDAAKTKLLARLRDEEEDG